MSANRVDPLGLTDYVINYNVVLGVELKQNQQVMLKKMIEYASVLVSRLAKPGNTLTFAVNQSGIVDDTYSGNYNTGAINWENFASGTIYVVGNIDDYQQGLKITAGSASHNTGILINANYLNFTLYDIFFSPLAHEIGHVGGYEGHSGDQNNIMWKEITQQSAELVAFDDIYKTAVRSLAQLE